MPIPIADVSDRPDRHRLTEFVAERIAEWIETRQLEAGERLPSEPQLMKRFGVSRNVVRESVSKLKALGVIEVYQGRGAFVAELPHNVLLMRVRRIAQQDALIAEIWEVRETLEIRIVELAATRATAADLIEIAAAVRAVDEAVAAGQLGTLEDQSFHRSLAHATHNVVLEQLMSEVVELMRPLLERLLAAQPNRPVVSNEEHGAILSALQQQNPVAARAAMKIHLENGRQMFAMQSQELLSPSS